MIKIIADINTLKRCQTLLKCPTSLVITHQTKKSLKKIQKLFTRMSYIFFVFIYYGLIFALLIKIYGAV